MVTRPVERFQRMTSSDPAPDPRRAGGASAQRKVTPRELEVLALIAEGYSTREIAQTLWIAEETVRTHVRRLLARVGARTRAQAVAIAYRENLWAKEGEAS